jgi:predicted nucleotidyltransferase
MTASDLAARVGLTENAIRKLEAGDSREPRFTTGLRMARELNITPEKLAGEAFVRKSQGPDLASVVRRIRQCRDDLSARGIVHVRVFGSVARGEARADSDIDLVVDPGPAADFSLIDLAETEALLERALSHRVDVLTAKTLERASFAKAAYDEAVYVF